MAKRIQPKTLLVLVGVVLTLTSTYSIVQYFMK
jgi:hypothetical protein